MIKSKFYQLYQDQAVIDLKWTNVQQAFQKIQKTNNRTFGGDVLRMLNNNNRGRNNNNNV